MADSEDRMLMLIDDDRTQSRMIGSLVSREGWRMVVAADLDAAIDRLGERDCAKVSAIILDEKVAGEHAGEAIRALRQAWPAVPLLMVTASESPLLAVDAMRAGATDYLIKPVAPERMLSALRNATNGEADTDELQPLAEKLPSQIGFDQMIGTASNFRAAVAKAAKAARRQGHVLVEGEHGTGKEMLLRAMHATSPRAKGPLYIINARSAPAGSVQSMLFGHEPNAFPGAFDRRVGALQACDCGTLIIDEIDRLDMDLQQKLAAMLREGVVRPLGADHGYRVDVRLMGATNMPIGDGENPHFHPDLLEAMQPTRIVLPALRERSSDIPALARHFLARIGEKPGLRHLSISDGALALLAAFDWPGNVRQLQAVLFRAAVFCDGQSLSAASFPQLSAELGEIETNVRSTDGAGVVLFTEDGNLRPLEAIEADVIRLAIGHYRGRMTEVARRLGIGRSTLYRKLGDLGIDNAA